MDLRTIEHNIKMNHFITEQNISISKRVGFAISDNDSIAWFPTGFFTFVNDPEFFKQSAQCPTNDLKFHSSWDWIMYAVVFIEGIEEPLDLDPQKGTHWPYEIVRKRYNIEVYNDGKILFGVGGSGVKSMHTAVTRFFEWYEKK